MATNFRNQWVTSGKEKAHPLCEGSLVKTSSRAGLVLKYDLELNS
jgi:hypothetical protein